MINASLNSVSCPSADSCVAVGWFLGQIPGTSAFQNFTLAETWNGSTWTIVHSPSPRLPGGGAVLSSVSCTGPSSCMAVGSQGPRRNPTLFTLAEQWNGTAWRESTTPAPLTPGGTALNTVSCTSPAACMAVGYYGYNNGTGTSVTLAEQWDGTAWHQRTTPTPGRSGTLGGVACPAAADCMAVGAHFVPTGNLVNATLAERWGGRHWDVQPTPNPAGAGAAGLGSVSCTRPAACMGVGGGVDQTGESGFTVAAAWNGTAWQLLRTPSPGATSNELRGVACTAAPACMAVGDATGFGNEHTLAEAWNGTRWSVVPTPHP